MSGLDLADGTKIRKGAPDSVLAWVRERGGDPSTELSPEIERIARSGGTPLLLARNTSISASSTSRTSSSRTCATASTGCARWAFARS